MNKYMANLQDNNSILEISDFIIKSETDIEALDSAFAEANKTNKKVIQLCRFGDCEIKVIWDDINRASSEWRG